ncbi:MAG: hypothetical protein KF700_00660 [Hyphomonadaceae bacterium]|nr:hypothetical protein [Hyphomonadaceae bacterium]
MRKIRIAGAFLALSVVGSAASFAPAGAVALLEAQIFSTLCGDGRTGMLQRASLARMLAGAEAYAQGLPAAADAPPPLIPGLGDAHLPITSANSLVQQYFDQGVRYMNAFNHAEAVRAFRYAQTLDPRCAICAWGEAFALGPNINAPMEEGDHAPAFAAARRAYDLRAGVSPAELALIEALQTRYARVPPANRAPLDAAFADAMAAAADAAPEQDFIQVIAAEAAMDTQPWDYWEAGGREPKGRIGGALARVEAVLARSPNNSGAIHLYIHLVEASADPWRAEEAAQRLARAAPRAGHLVHMPAHIYYRVGRFRDSMRANIDAIAADEAFFRAAEASPLYRYGYYSHNVHFVLTSAAMAGDGRTALAYADRLDDVVPMDMAQAVALAQPVKAAPWFARAQFADPESVLAAPAPPEGVSYVSGAWRFARGVALARLGRADAARAEAAELRRLIETGDFTDINAAGVPAETVLETYRLLLLARVDMNEGAYPAAIAGLRRAVEMQQQMPYMEPPYLYYPLRRTLGAAYLLNGQPALAEMEFLQTLIESPNDAYAYWGLAEARRARGDRAGASAARQMFNSAFLGPRGRMSIAAL